jgi:putative PIN family toxin of toxin-antitoxin system
MPPKKARIPIVLDTNVLVAQILSKTRRSASSRVFDLWLVRRELQLVVSPPLIEEYLELLRRIRVAEERVELFHRRLLEAGTVTRVNLGKRFLLSRDPDDNMLLATAQAGRARYLVTNDRDLLDIPLEQRRPFRFDIITPYNLLRALSQ